jgi:hypothetical protein
MSMPTGPGLLGESGREKRQLVAPDAGSASRAAMRRFPEEAGH